MANTNLTNQRQVFVEEYVRSGDHLEAAKKAGYKDTATTVPDSTLQSLKTEANVSIHLPSILSCNISFPFFQ